MKRTDVPEAEVDDDAESPPPTQRARHSVDEMHRQLSELRSQAHARYSHNVQVQEQARMQKMQNALSVMHQHMNTATESNLGTYLSKKDKHAMFEAMPVHRLKPEVDSLYYYRPSGTAHHHTIQPSFYSWDVSTIQKAVVQPFKYVDSETNLTYDAIRMSYYGHQFDDAQGDVNQLEFYPVKHRSELNRLVAEGQNAKPRVDFSNYEPFVMTNPNVAEGAYHHVLSDQPIERMPWNAEGERRLLPTNGYKGVVYWTPPGISFPSGLRHWHPKNLRPLHKIGFQYIKR
jgi:hypothetical protein